MRAGIINFLAPTAAIASCAFLLFWLGSPSCKKLAYLFCSSCSGKVSEIALAQNPRISGHSSDLRTALLG